MANKTIKSAIESMMFVWGEPLAIKDIADIFNVDKKEIYEACKELQEEYEQEGRGIVIREVNKSFQFVTRKENLGYIERLCTPVRRRRLSQSALETLAIVAYKQPVTKGEIEAVRGIRCDRVLHAKYEAEKENDMQILERVVELADKRGVKVSQIALAWLLKKDVATLLVGATKPDYLNDAAEALKINLTDEETAYLEEPYRAHEIVGANK